MKVQELSNKTTGDDSDDDDVAALSDRWAYQKSVRRWARKSSDATSHDAETSHHDLPPHDIQQEVPVMTITVEETRQCQGLPHRTANRALTAEVPVKLLDGGPLTGTQEEVDVGFQHVPDTPKLLRVATDRLKGVFRMNSFRKKTSKPSTKINVFEIGDPVISNLDFMQAKLKTLNCVDLVTKDQVIVSSTSPSLMSPTSRPVESSVKCVSGSATTAKCRCASEISRSHSCSEFRSATRCLPSAEFQSPAHDGNKPQTTARVTVSKNIDSSLVEVFLLPQDHKPGSFPRLLRNGFVDTTPPTTTPQYSLTPTPKALCIRPQACREIDTCMSVYDNCSLPPGKRVGPRRPPRTADPVPGDSPWTPALPCDSELGVASNSRLTDVTSPLNTYKVGMVESNSMGLGGKTVSCPPSFSSLLPVSVSNSRLHPIPSRAANCDTSETTLIMAEFDRVLQDLYRDIDSLDQFTKGHKVDDPPPSSQSAGILFPDGHCHYNSFCYQRVVDSSTSDANLSCSTLNGDFSRTSHSETESLPGCVEDSVDDCLDVGGCSRTTSSFESGDDVTKRTGTDDLDGAVNGARERRDSGVGLSLTRNSRERKKKIRWESFQKRHCPCSSGQDVSTGCLTVWQVSRLRQLAFLKVTSVMEGGSSPSQALHWPWVMPRFMKRHKTSHCCNRRVFGVPLIVTCQRTGQPLPQCILAAMRHLRKSCREAVGIFRKSGVRSRIKKLRHFVEENSDCVDFDHLQAYDVADLLKQFFRELPECLLSNKLSDTFRTIFTQVSEVDRLDTLRSTIALLPEENQEVLHCLLFFLQDISQHADEHQMSARNLAVCFAPSLFSFPGSHNMSSPRQPRKNHRVSEQIELLEQRGTHECFTFMISDCQQLFKVSLSMYECLQLTAASCNLEPVPLSEFYSPADHRGPNFKVFGEEQIQAALKDVHDKNNSRCWVAMPTSAPGVEVAWCKLNDGHPLRQWKCCVEIDASPVEVLTRILHQRHTWDYDLLSCSVAEKLDKHSDIFCYTVSTMPPHPAREFTVLRYWRPDLANGACAVVSTSVAYSSSLDGKGSGGAVIAVDLGTSYHVEASGSGRRCRLTYITRVDLRGRSADWYNRCFGHFCCNFIDRFRASFQQDWNDPSSTITSMTGTTRPPPSPA